MSAATASERVERILSVLPWIVEAPGMTPVSVPLVAANDVAKASLMGRATGTLTYLIWGTPAS